MKYKGPASVGLLFIFKIQSILMRKFLLAVYMMISFLNGHCQKNYSLSASANFDFLTEGLGTNDAGIGLTVHSNLFAKKKLQLRAEGSLDHFVGSKEVMIDSVGNHYYDEPTMISIKAGPEFYVTKNISVAALYGYVQYKEFRENVHSGNFKFVLTVRPPRHPNMLIGFQFTKLTGDNSYVHFVAINLGFGIL